ncbi:MAG: hypothetical protein QM791_16850 [Ferruginibacter sp.]
MIRFAIDIMEQVMFLILQRINAGNGNVSWYQIDRLLRSGGLHSYLGSLTGILAAFEENGLIRAVQQENKTPQLFITEKGKTELEKLRLVYGNK